MTHFLARLVDRARGSAPRVEPIVAPHFAPAPVAEIASEHETPQETKATSGTREALVREEELATDRPRLRKEKPASRETEERQETVEAAPQTLLVPLERTDGDEVLPRPDRTRGSESLRSDALPHVRSATAPTIVRRAEHPGRSANLRPTDRLSVSPNESAANEPPIVRVTIGRIEVRAEPAPAPAPRKISSRSEPKLTLDAYLKSRKEGAR
ncbi:MAG: hypothetical protein WCE51_04450 [Chthoniobacterales bacterium]|jgi:hypothetical protein